MSEINLPDMDLPKQIISALRSVTGCSPVALHEPIFSGNEWLYLKDCLDSTFVSSVGRYVDRFESDLVAYTGAKFAIAVVNGTAALHVALKLSGVEFGDEVLVPALTFIATANAVSYCNATPHFVDSDVKTLGMDAVRLREYLKTNTEQHGGKCINLKTGKIISAMVPMHTFGHPVDLDGLLSISQDFNIALIEDAAESLGSFYCGKHTGTFGKFGTLSFNGNKIITTGGGGAILTDDQSLAKKAKHITTTAKLPHQWAYEHDEVGFNYRMPNLNAALGCAQLEKLPEFLNAKRNLFHLYEKAFEGVGGLSILKEPDHCQSNYWLQGLLLDFDTEIHRDEILIKTNDVSIMTRPAWVLMHKLTPFNLCPRMDLTTSELISNRLINIPSSSNLPKK